MIFFNACAVRGKYYLLRSADKADDKHLLSCSLYLRSLAWNSLAASVLIMAQEIL